MCLPGTPCVNATVATHKLKSALSACDAPSCNSELDTVSSALLTTQMRFIVLDEFACQPGRSFSSELESNSCSRLLWNQQWSLMGHTHTAHCSGSPLLFIRATAWTPSWDELSCLCTAERESHTVTCYLTYTKRHCQSAICIFKSDKKRRDSLWLWDGSANTSQINKCFIIFNEKCRQHTCFGVLWCLWHLIGNDKFYWKWSFF